MSDELLVTTDGAVKKLTSNSDYSYSGAEFSPDGAWIMYRTGDLVIQEIGHYPSKGFWCRFFLKEGIRCQFC